MAKRRKKKKRTGLLNQMARPVMQDEKKFTYAEIFEGKASIPPEGVERIKDVWESVTATSPDALVTEARGYGYPLKSLVNFYIEVHQEWIQTTDDPADFDGLQGNIDYLKSVESWEDFEPLMEGLEGAPPENAPPCVPTDLVDLIIDKRMLALRDERTVEHAKSIPVDDAIVYLGVDFLREHRGLPISTNATALDMNVDSYEVFIDALKARANDDEKISMGVRLNESRIKRGHFDRTDNG